MRLSTLSLLFIVGFSAACSQLEQVGQAPGLTPVSQGAEHQAMAYGSGLSMDVARSRASDHASLWSRGRQSLLGDRRAQRSGDILTVVIEINDRAEFSNTSTRGRTGTESMEVSSLFGLPEVINEVLPEGASLSPGVATTSTSASSGTGNVRRNEKLTLRVAATVVGTLPNGVLQIQGSQEVRVNFELRELLVTGFVRPEDISRQNEIAYDKIASARISYGGRGQITDMQQPRLGQQIVDIILPF